MAAAPSVPDTSAPIPLGGPVFIFLRIVGYAIVAGALLVTIDALRRPAAAFNGNSAKRWMWAGPQLLLLVLIALTWAAALFEFASFALLQPLAGVLSLYLLLCGVLQIVYLLVVVFPRRRTPVPPEVDQELEHE